MGGRRQRAAGSREREGSAPAAHSALSVVGTLDRKLCPTSLLRGMATTLHCCCWGACTARRRLAGLSGDRAPGSALRAAPPCCPAGLARPPNEAEAAATRGERRTAAAAAAADDDAAAAAAADDAAAAELCWAAPPLPGVLALEAEAGASSSGAAAAAAAAPASKVAALWPLMSSVAATT